MTKRTTVIFTSSTDKSALKSALRTPPEQVPDALHLIENGRYQGCITKNECLALKEKTISGP
ncbi:MAG: hypothetical protein AB8B99_18840 [Phormidesmis sp.]